ncbi:TIGR03750 family conjugal transfer protein [Pseudomonas sp. MYb185]|jgi:conjugative transfer region protein (TIGR03750 family)|uniref:TIGR03750 family conjugal transfer protein n=1 Tax=Pseudomonas sp. MYb185 TaxID=1848729 RepID=UPI000CFA855F|nr:TIGR03750 family conjugal transfer protein [Pseudomonas sp. MYb185]PRB81519.1 TIGR03750 family conjugal transfer protein [Pseudomonas sp. MYb185]
MADTISWVPKRLNAAPIVFRGMTGKEVATLTLAGLGVFTPIGIVAALVMGMIAMAPTVAFLGAGLTLFFGGTIMRRLRRGRPTSLMYRQLQFYLACKGIASGEKLITRTTRYSIRRHPPLKPDFRKH